MHTLHVPQHNFNAQGLTRRAIRLCHQQTLSLKPEIPFAEIQRWRSVNVEIGLLHLLWLRLLTSYLASGQIPTLGNNPPV